MTTFAYLFPGQGSQALGMGMEFFGDTPTGRARLEEACDILGFDIGALMQHGPESELGLTANTQPAILLHSLVAYEAIQAQYDPPPAAVAGHSLGEFSACCAAGVFSFADAIRIVRKRGELMQSAVPVGVGSMAAIIGPTSEEVTAICQESGGEVYPANFNSPEQTVIAGATADVERACTVAIAKGVKKVVPLSVSAPFHTSFMKPAQEGLATFMADIPFAKPAFPLIRNVDATLVTTADEVRDGLIRQVTGCVRWVESMQTLAGLGVTVTCELGPGKVLMGLMRRIDRGVKVIPVGAPEDMVKGIEGING